MERNAERLSVRVGVDEDGDQRVSRFASEMETPAEKKMTLWAVKFALLEKGISMLGTLNFIWATAVLLGGFVSSLERTDFFYVSIMLVGEGLRIFGRWGELEGSRYTIIKIYSFFIQDFSGMILGSLPMSRLLLKVNGQSNQGTALYIFYCLSLVECSLIPFGLSFRIAIGISPLWPYFNKKYPWRSVGNLLLKVKKEYDLHDSQVRTVHLFFHNAYSRCICGSIFDGLKMEFVSYSVELLQSSYGDEQLRGARLLSALVKRNPLALDERLRSIGTIRGVVEMLIDMLNWRKFKSDEDQEIQREAAEIILTLVSIDRYRILVMATTDSMESVASLLYDNNQIGSNEHRDGDEYPYSEFSLLGLRILKRLAIDHHNRAKIGSNKGLLLKIIRLTELDGDGLECQLKILAMETLTSIARDQEVRDSIGGIDGVLHPFFSLFFVNINEKLVSKAGEFLSFLSLENNQNCEIMMTIKLHHHPNLILSLISVLKEPVRGTYAARILRNLYVYAEANCVELKGFTAASAQVVASVMEREDVNQEAAIGLAAQIFKCMTKSDFDCVFNEQGAGAAIRRSLISKLLEVLRRHPSPSKEVPNIRRFTIQLLIALMVMDRSSIEMRSDLEAALEEVMKSTSVLESYSTFSGSVGLRSHRMAIPFLVQSAMELLHN